jgi:hypothetical protein
MPQVLSLRPPPAPPSMATATGHSSIQSDVFLGACPFQYQPLSASEPEIRLIRVRGRNHSYTDIGYSLDCELFHVRIEELPPYKCLSYTWGSASDRVYSILVNGQDFKVRKNLWRALKRLQLENEELLIWIDAICINQQDNHERSEQVKMMRKIYETADETYVWLGPHRYDSHLAMELLRDLESCAGDEKRVLERFRRPGIDRYLYALEDLYCRKYWNRVWIVQELVLAKSIRVFCGKEWVSWGAFEKARETFTKMSAKSELFRLILNNTDGSLLSTLRRKDHCPMLVDITRKNFRKRSLEMFETVFEYKPMSASDPRDLIYGLLGIVDEKESRNIEIDYSKPVARVYIDFTKRMILDSERLDILAEVNNVDPNMDGLPSWVPDLSKPIGGHTVLQPVHSAYWDASKPTTAHYSFPGEDNVLVMEGLNIGCIRQIRTSSYSSSDVDLERTFEIFFDWLDMIDSTSGDLDQNMVAFADVLTMGRYRRSDGKRSKTLDVVIAAFARFSAQIAPNSSVHPRLADYDRPPLKISEEEHESWGERRIVKASKWMWNRCCFLIDSGTFGLAPGFAAEGDILCIPLGCLSPLVLRPCGNYYTVIGEAYIHGFMNGEAISLLKEGELKVEEFEVH